MGIKQRCLWLSSSGLIHSAAKGARVGQLGTPGSLYHQGKSQPPPRMIQNGGGLNYPMDLPVSTLTVGGTQRDRTSNLRASPHCLNLDVAADKHSNGLQHTAAFHSSFCSSLCLQLIMEQLWIHILTFFRGKILHTNRYSSWLWNNSGY